MAVTHSGRMIQMTAAADNTSSIFGTDADLLVSAIGIQWTGASSTCTLKQTDTNGPIIISFTPAGTSSTTLISFGSPMYFNNIYVAALPAKPHRHHLPGLRSRDVRKFLLTLAALLALSPVAWAADRHVYLDTDADGQLNDCPNPSHNAKGTSNTDELSYCSGGTSAGKIIGTATGRVASGTCTGGGGSVANVTRQ